VWLDLLDSYAAFRKIMFCVMELYVAFGLMRWQRNNHCSLSYDVTALVGGSRPPPCRGFEITLRHTTLGRLLWTGDRSAAGTSPCHTKHSQETDIRVNGGFEAAILASERLHTHAIYRAATGLGVIVASSVKFGTASYIDCNLVVTSR
jgi:hypothetical protein